MAIVRKAVRRSRVVALALALGLAACGGEAAPDQEPAAAAEPAPTVSADALVGSWDLLRIDMGDGEDVEPVADATPTLTFTAEADPTGSRRFHGSGGCNRMNGSYDAGSTGRISFGAGVAMTMMMCPEGVMQVEHTLASALEAARTWSVEEDRLSIDFGGGVLVFGRADG